MCLKKITASTPFCKYRDINNNTLKALKNCEIWPSITDKFNDPHDCVGRLLLKHHNRFSIQYEVFENLVEAVESELGPQYQFDRGKISDPPYAYLLKEVEAEIIKSTKNCPIYCVSGKNDVPLMWAHYANGLQGFCIEFDRKIPFFNEIMQVQYKPSLPILVEVYRPVLKAIWRASYCLANNDEDFSNDPEYLNYVREFIQKAFCIKLDHWDYEEDLNLLDTYLLYLEWEVVRH